MFESVISHVDFKQTVMNSKTPFSRRLLGTGLKLLLLDKTVKRECDIVMAWDIFTYCVMGRLEFIGEKSDDIRYVCILSDRFFEIVALLDQFPTKWLIV